MPRVFTPEEERLLCRLLEVNVLPKYGSKGAYYEKIAKLFNCLTLGKKHTASQIKTYHNTVEVQKWKNRDRTHNRTGRPQRSSRKVHRDYEERSQKCEKLENVPMQKQTSGQTLNSIEEMQQDATDERTVSLLEATKEVFFAEILKLQKQAIRIGKTDSIETAEEHNNINNTAGTSTAAYLTACRSADSMESSSQSTVAGSIQNADLLDGSTANGVKTSNMPSVVLIETEGTESLNVTADFHTKADMMDDAITIVKVISYANKSPLTSGPIENNAIGNTTGTKNGVKASDQTPFSGLVENNETGTTTGTTNGVETMDQSVVSSLTENIRTGTTTGTKNGMETSNQSAVSGPNKNNTTDRKDANVISLASTDPLPGQENEVTGDDLLRVLIEKAQQEHIAKMKIFEEESQQTIKFYRMKIKHVKDELATRRKEHERRMDMIAKEYEKVKKRNDD